MTKNKNARARTRNWTFLVYPDSAPQNWRSVIDSIHVPWVESPLHNKDTNPDGSIKKPHWHILIMFDGNKSYDQVRKITLKLKSPNPQKVISAKGIVRYFIHMDNPEKYQYDKAQITEHAGADISRFFASSTTQRYELIKEMISFVKIQNITEMSDLIDYAMNERFYDWFPLLTDNSARIVESYIRSLRYSNTEHNKDKD